MIWIGKLLHEEVSLSVLVLEPTADIHSYFSIGEESITLAFRPCDSAFCFAVCIPVTVLSFCCGKVRLQARHSRGVELIEWELVSLFQVGRRIKSADGWESVSRSDTAVCRLALVEVRNTTRKTVSCSGFDHLWGLKFRDKDLLDLRNGETNANSNFASPPQIIWAVLPLRYSVNNHPRFYNAYMSIFGFTGILDITKPLVITCWERKCSTRCRFHQ